MSFVDDVSGMLGSIFNTDNLITGAKIAGLSLLLNQLQPDEKKPNPKGTREQLDPDVTHGIPIVYGICNTAGIVSDAVMTDDSMTMWYCLTICEQTGKLMSTGADSVIGIDAVYWNENVIDFQNDGVTAASFTDASGNTDTKIKDMIKFYCYSGNSLAANQVFPSGKSGTKANAWSHMPKWTQNHMMNDLVFCLVKVTYDNTKGVTGLGNVTFKIHNTLTKPGDVLYDYMTNTRYGCGITAEEIYKVTGENVYE